jgi:hypothetical protein
VTAVSSSDEAACASYLSLLSSTSLCE